MDDVGVFGFDLTNGTPMRGIQFVRIAHWEAEDTNRTQQKPRKIKKTNQSVRSRKYTPPGTNAYATVNKLARARRQYTKNAVVYVRVTLPLAKALVRWNTIGVIDIVQNANPSPPA
jgi:hypothetical protein